MKRTPTQRQTALCESVSFVEGHWVRNNTKARDAIREQMSWSNAQWQHEATSLLLEGHLSLLAPRWKQTRHMTHATQQNWNREHVEESGKRLRQICRVSNRQIKESKSDPAFPAALLFHPLLSSWKMCGPRSQEGLCCRRFKTNHIVVVCRYDPMQPGENSCVVLCLQDSHTS